MAPLDGTVCRNCWKSVKHSLKKCPELRRTTYEREMQRVKVGFPLLESWVAQLEKEDLKPYEPAEGTKGKRKERDVEPRIKREGETTASGAVAPIRQQEDDELDRLSFGLSHLRASAISKISSHAANSLIDVSAEPSPVISAVSSQRQSQIEDNRSSYTDELLQLLDKPDPSANASPPRSRGSSASTTAPDTTFAIASIQSQLSSLKSDTTSIKSRMAEHIRTFIISETLIREEFSNLKSRLTKLEKNQSYNSSHASNSSDVVSSSNAATLDEEQVEKFGEMYEHYQASWLDMERLVVEITKVEQKVSRCEKRISGLEGTVDYLVATVEPRSDEEEEVYDDDGGSRWEYPL